MSFVLVFSVSEATTASSATADGADGIADDGATFDVVPVVVVASVSARKWEIQTLIWMGSCGWLGGRSRCIAIRGIKRGHDESRSQRALWQK